MPKALDAAQSISATGLQGDATLALLGDIYAHLGDTAKATQIFADAINRNPDNDQYYLSLTLIELREGNIADAENTLHKGLARIPNSGKIIWGLGLVSVLEGKTVQAGTQLERAVELLPEWVGSYSTLGVFYFQTGQIDKAREVLNRFKGSNAGGLDVGRIEETLSSAPAVPMSGGKPLPHAGQAAIVAHRIDHRRSHIVTQILWIIMRLRIKNIDLLFLQFACA